MDVATVIGAALMVSFALVFFLNLSKDIQQRKTEGSIRMERFEERRLQIESFLQEKQGSSETEIREELFSFLRSFSPRNHLKQNANVAIILELGEPPIEVPFSIE